MISRREEEPEGGGRKFTEIERLNKSDAYFNYLIKTFAEEQELGEDFLVQELLTVLSLAKEELLERKSKDDEVSLKEIVLSYFKEESTKAKGEAVLLRAFVKHIEKSSVDSLTKVLNREKFNIQLESLMSSEEEVHKNNFLFLFIIDLDKFKLVNDKYGHSGGNKVLIRVGKILRNVLREGDYAYRIGGDEFSVLATGSNEEDGRVLLKRINDAFDGLKIDISGNDSESEAIDIEVSVGFGIYDRDGTDDRLTPEEFFNQVDQNLYELKEVPPFDTIN